MCHPGRAKGAIRDLHPLLLKKIPDNRFAVSGMTVSPTPISPMPTITLIAVHKLKSGPYRDAFDDYAKRMTTWKLRLHELDVRDHGSSQTSAEHAAIIAALDKSAPLIAFDERGKTMDSAGFSGLIARHFDTGTGTIQCVIGGADGLNDEIRARAQHIISFGSMTWPHMLARVMAVEQFYRAQQIHAGHPYHRG